MRFQNSTFAWIPSWNDFHQRRYQRSKEGSLLQTSPHFRFPLSNFPTSVPYSLSICGSLQSTAIPSIHNILHTAHGSDHLALPILSQEELVLLSILQISKRPSPQQGLLKIALD